MQSQGYCVRLPRAVSCLSPTSRLVCAAGKFAITYLSVPVSGVQAPRSHAAALQ